MSGEGARSDLWKVMFHCVFTEWKTGCPDLAIGWGWSSTLVEYLPSMFKAIDLISSLEEGNEERGERREEGERERARERTAYSGVYAFAVFLDSNLTLLLTGQFSN